MNNLGLDQVTFYRQAIQPNGNDLHKDSESEIITRLNIRDSEKDKPGLSR